MKRTEAILAATLLPLWIVTFLLHVSRVSDGRLAWPGLWVDPPTAGVAGPRVSAFWPETHAEDSGLQVGDLLLEAGGISIAGQGPAAVFAQLLAAANERLEVPITYQRNEVRAQTTLALTPVAFPWRAIPVTLGFAIAGAVVLFRRQGAEIGRAFFVAALLYGFHWNFFFGGAPSITYAWLVVFAIASTVLYPLMLWPIFVLVRDAGTRPGRLPAWPWVFAAFGPISTGWVVGVPLPPLFSLRAAFLVTMLWLACALVVLTRGYRRAQPLARRQLRWVVYGLYVGTAPLLAANFVLAIRPELWWLYDVANLATVLIPICFFVAIVKFNMFDVDRLISSTTAYSVLSILLIAGLLTIVPWLANLLSVGLGTDPTQTQMALSALLAVSLVPGGRALRPRIERIFFAERHALEQGVDALLRDLDRGETPEGLLEVLGRRLDELLRPEGCLIYGSLEEGLGLVFERGRFPQGDVPTLLTSPAESMPHGSAPIDLTAASRGRPADLEALAQLGATLALTIRRSGRVTALLALGPKRSGDVYSATDRALLRAVAEKASDVLQRFDEAAVLRQARSMRDAYRRYVPSSVADRLARGEDLVGGERELSILFADVRGYTSYSEGRQAGDVFSVVNVLTEAVSEQIRRHGGTVVEFLGDGVMAVFGAPRTLPGHASAAVAASRAIVEAIAKLRLGGAASQRPLAVGVGIATGPAFVGNVETKERLIYTAIGDTVNLASRLQALTRELGAVVAIDQSTLAAAGVTADGFESRGAIEIRGRRERAEVFILPLAETVDSSRSRRDGDGSSS
ncbi:MAG: hypothetical protein FJ144_14730 [Deltaproteobacteria bacterium]|nr:hypothetical protein [Deltaproteobacteria bacterium]